MKALKNLVLACAAEVCGVLGVLSMVKDALDSLGEKHKIDFSIRFNCQSTIHRFLLRQRVVTLGSKLSYKAYKLLHIKQLDIRNLKTFKIEDYHEKVKKAHELFF